MYKTISLIAVAFAFIAGATLARAQTPLPAAVNPGRGLIVMAPGCLFQADTVRIRPGDNIPGRMSLRNTGQWCMGSIGMSEASSRDARILTPPNHGELRMQIGDRGVVFIYRPVPGYQGSDRFMIAVASVGGADYNLAASVTVDP